MKKLLKGNEDIVKMEKMLDQTEKRVTKELRYSVD